MQPPKPPAPVAMEGPSGVDLHPTPPDPARLSKRAGMLFLAVVVAVIGFIVYGMYDRNQRRFGAADRSDAGNLTAATEAGAQILSLVPEGAVRGQNPTSGSDAPLKPPDGAEGDSSQKAHVLRADSPGITQYREPSPEERRRAALYERQLAAMEAPTRTGAGTGEIATMHAPVLPASPADTSEITSLLQSLQPTGSANASPSLPGMPRGLLGGGGGPSASEEYHLQNMQDQKAAFLTSARSKSSEDYVPATRAAPITRYVIRAGWDIPAVLEQGMNSDLPGEVRALVRESVYDTASGKYLLIPQGSRVVGRYNSQVGYAQSGLQVIWERLIFPDASAIDIGAMNGQDAAGRSGFRDGVDNHYKRLVAFGLLTSVFTAAIQLSQNHSGNVLTYPSPGEVTAGAVGQQMGSLGAETTRRNLNVQPTIKIPAGYRFNVRVNRDLAFEGPYHPIGSEPRR